MQYPSLPQYPVIIFTGAEQPAATTTPNQSPEPPAMSPPHNPFVLAGCNLIPFSQRCRAAGIDAALVCLLAGFMVMATLLLDEYWPPGYARLNETAMSTILVALPAAVSWLYFAGLEGSPTQATVGKLFFNARVRTIDGKPMGFLRASVRFFIKAITILLLPVALISALIAYRFERRQAIHDLVARTLVVARDSK